MTYLMGIDGGGSTLRIVVTDHDLQVQGQFTGDTVNPSVIGRDAAAQRIHQGMLAAINDASVPPVSIERVGIGVAGASATHSTDWLQAVIANALPDAEVVPSSDYEIALIGAHGKRFGILLLAGTGSLAYGVNDCGDSALVGGWGYLIGDEGSGLWLGLEALRATVYAADKRGSATALEQAILHQLRIEVPRAIIPWLYSPQTVPTATIAQLAPLVLRQSAAGDAVAQTIVERAADALAAHVNAIKQQLAFHDAPIAFTGGLLSEPNPLTNALCQRLDLQGIPATLHPPVIGAVIMTLGRE